MKLVLDDASASVLREVLEAAARDLSYEIADTDNPEFKRTLDERAERLHSIIDQFPGRG